MPLRLNYDDIPNQLANPETMVGELSCDRMWELFSSITRRIVWSEYSMLGGCHELKRTLSFRERESEREPVWGVACWLEQPIEIERHQSNPSTL